MILLLENNIRGGISSVMGDRFVKSDDIKKIIYINATNLYGHSMFQMLPYDEIEMFVGDPDLHIKKLEEVLKTPDGSNIGYSIEVELKYPNDMKEKAKSFPFAAGNKIINKDNFDDYIKKIRPKKYTKAKKLLCDWTVEKKSLIPYRMLKFYVKHGMIVEKILEIISFKQSKCLD